MSTYYTSQNRLIQLGNSMGSGGEGTVYECDAVEFPKHCAKIYNFRTKTLLEEIAEKEAKIRYIVNQRPDIYITAGRKIKVCWPIELLYKDSNCQGFVGFLMEQAFENSLQLYQLTLLNAPVKPQWETYQRNHPDSFKLRLRLCAHLAITVYKIHQNRAYTFVDLNPRNLLISTQGEISVIDTDSMQLNADSKIFHGPVSTPEYCPPESQTLDSKTNLVPQSWDLFQLAVLYYELLFGLHPYTASSKDSQLTTILQKIRAGLFVHGKKSDLINMIPPPHRAFEQLDQSLQLLFQRVFEDGTDNPELRPTADEWGAAITKLLKVPIDVPPQSSPSDSVDPPQPTPVDPPQPTPPTPVDPTNWGWIVYILFWVVWALLRLLGIIGP